MSTSFERKLIIVVVLLATLAPFVGDLYLPAFKIMGRELNANASEVQYTLSAWFIGAGIGQLFYGPLSDVCGRKGPLLFGLVLFVVTSIGCAMAPSIDSLIGLRFVQSLGSCVAMVMARALIRDYFTVAEGASVLSLSATLMGIAPIVAPIIGLIIIDTTGWRSIFYYLAGYGVLLALLVSFWIPRKSQTDGAQKSSLHGTLVLVVSGYRDVLSHARFMLMVLCGSCMTSILFGYISASPFVFMEYFAYSKEAYSIVFAIIATGMVIGAVLNRYLLKKFDAPSLLLWSGLATLLGGVLAPYSISLHRTAVGYLLSACSLL